MLYVQTPSAATCWTAHCYQKLLVYLSVNGKLIILTAESNFSMKNFYLLEKADLFLTKPLLSYHLLFGLKSFIASKHLKNFSKFNLGISDCGIINDVWDGRVWMSFNRENDCGDCFF